MSYRNQMLREFDNGKYYKQARRETKGDPQHQRGLPNALGFAGSSAPQSLHPRVHSKSGATTYKDTRKHRSTKNSHQNDIEAKKKEEITKAIHNIIQKVNINDKLNSLALSVDSGKKPNRELAPNKTLAQRGLGPASGPSLSGKLQSPPEADDMLDIFTGSDDLSLSEDNNGEANNARINNMEQSMDELVQHVMTLEQELERLVQCQKNIISVINKLSSEINLAKNKITR